MKNVLLLSAVILIFLVGCKKRKWYDLEDDEVRRATTFKEGSYFIYRD